MQELNKILYLLNPAEKKQAAVLLFMFIIMALIETLGVASIMPFLSVLSDPSIIHSNSILERIFNLLSFSNDNSFLIFLGLIVFAFLIASNVFKTIATWSKLKYVQLRGHSLSQRLLEMYLSRSYSFFLNRNSSDITKNILSEVFQVAGGILLPVLEILANIVVALFLILLIVFLNPLVSLIAGSVLSISYFIVYRVIRVKLHLKGIDRVCANKERYKISMEAFGGIKELKILGVEDNISERFQGPSKRFAYHQAFSQIVAVVPKYILEVIILGVIFLVSFFLLFNDMNNSELIPFLGLYAYAGYRLMPAIQNVFSSYTAIRFALPALNNIFNELKSHTKKVKIESNNDNITPFRFSNNIEFLDVSFRYPEADAYALYNVDLTIEAGSSVGFIGSTGSGKSTCVDILLGLLKPTSGSVFVDGSMITDLNVKQWQLSLGYVPQSIFLSDDTILSNIAFGQKEELIDLSLIVRSAKIAHIHDFIINELPLGYNTTIGERGVKLSGGQRQRIGIARALYRNPQVLVLDEATSALDNITESDVMDSIYSLDSQKTLIIIAHRLSTIRNCDNIYFFENGRIRAQGSYQDLSRFDISFQKMLQSSSNI